MQVFYMPIVHQRRDNKKTYIWNVDHHTHTCTNTHNLISNCIMLQLSQINTPTLIWSIAPSIHHLEATRMPATKSSWVAAYKERYKLKSVILDKLIASPLQRPYDSGSEPEVGNTPWRGQLAHWMVHCEYTCYPCSTDPAGKSWSVDHSLQELTHNQRWRHCWNQYLRTNKNAHFSLLTFEN